MKVNVKNKGFSPINMEITIESKDELMALWHRLNFGVSSIVDGYYERYDSVDEELIRSKACTELWGEIDDIVNEMDIIK